VFFHQRFSFGGPPMHDCREAGEHRTIGQREKPLMHLSAARLPIIPEIDIKIESIAVTAVTRKLRARWSPELAQDLNAYHSLDAEVELTQILSEQIALEIDREILNDLLTQANGANLYWSRAPGKFVNKETGNEVLVSDSLAPGPTFQGTVREWYETLVETIIDAANTIHRKTLRGSANFVVCSPDVATVLEASVLGLASDRPGLTLWTKAAPVLCLAAWVGTRRGGRTRETIGLGYEPEALPRMRRTGIDERQGLPEVRGRLTHAIEAGACGYRPRARPIPRLLRLALHPLRAYG